jgi:hypothetical protein
MRYATVLTDLDIRDLLLTSIRSQVQLLPPSINSEMPVGGLAPRRPRGHRRHQLFDRNFGQRPSGPIAAQQPQRARHRCGHPRTKTPRGRPAVGHIPAVCPGIAGIRLESAAGSLGLLLAGLSQQTQLARSRATAATRSGARGGSGRNSSCSDQLPQTPPQQRLLFVRAHGGWTISSSLAESAQQRFLRSSRGGVGGSQNAERDRHS